MLRSIVFARLAAVLFVAQGMALYSGCTSEGPPLAVPPSDSSPASIESTAAHRPPPPSEDFAFLHQPFDRAVLSGANAPRGVSRPPDKTLTGKSIGKLYSEVERGWDSVRFIDHRGGKLAYTAVIHTDLGEIELELLPDLAPNHVRSFVALAEIGYYDGLCFEGRETVETDNAVIRAIAGGSPRGDGDDTGGVGYWLPPEILRAEEADRRGVKHRPGMVGMRHGVRHDSAAARFYICLTDASPWDGEFTLFAAVKRGLDAAEAIYRRPTNEHLGEPNTFADPPIIRRIAITVKTAGG